MFRRYPYWGWLVLGLLMWGINGYYYYLRGSYPDIISASAHLLEKSENGQKEIFLDTIFSERSLLRRHRAGLRARRGFPPVGDRVLPGGGAACIANAGFLPGGYRGCQQ